MEKARRRATLSAALAVVAAASLLVGLAGCSKQKAASSGISPSATAYEADLSERDRTSLAIEFATRYWTTASASSTTATTDAENYSSTWDWNTKCLVYCKPGSSVYEDFRTKRAGGAGSPGFLAKSVACAVTKSAGNVVSVAVDVAERTDASDDTWDKTANRIYAMDLTYDEDNLVTGFSYRRTDGDDGTVTSY
ncbi:MAG: hypothetical protein WAY93_03270 [Atopobiaceae bacterium]|jgi:hypothetical protein